jgi:hypothetical protein
MFPKELDLTMSQKCIQLAGVDEDGNNIFGIRLLSGDGEEEWYDPRDTNSQTLLGWDDERDARIELENNVLPQIGYAIHQKDIVQFHKIMGELVTES